MENLRLGIISVIRSNQEISRRVKRWLRGEGNSVTLENLSQEMFHQMMEELGINRPTEDPRHSIPKELDRTGSLYYTVEQREDFPQFPSPIPPIAEGGVQGEGLRKHQRQVDSEAVKSTTVDTEDISEANTIEEQVMSDEDSTSTNEPVSFAASLTAQVDHTNETEGAASSVHVEHSAHQLPNRQDEDSTTDSYYTDEESTEGSLISDTTSVRSGVPDTQNPVLPQQQIHTQVTDHVAPRAQGLVAGATTVPHGQLYDQNLNAFQAINCLTRMLEDLMNRNIEPENRRGEQHLQILGIKIEELKMTIARLQGDRNTLEQKLLAKEDEKENNLKVIYFLHEELVKRKNKIEELKQQMKRLEKKHVEKIEEFDRELEAFKKGLFKNAEALGKVQENYSNLSDENKLLKEKCQLQKVALEAYEKRDEENKEIKRQMAFLVEKLDEKFLNEVQKREQDLEELVAYGKKH